MSFLIESSEGFSILPASTRWKQSRSASASSCCASRRAASAWRRLSTARESLFEALASLADVSEATGTTRADKAPATAFLRTGFTRWAKAVGLDGAEMKFERVAVAPVSGPAWL